MKIDLEKLKNKVSHIFPRLKADLGFALLVISFVGFASGIIWTATTRETVSIMSSDFNEQNNPPATETTVPIVSAGFEPIEEQPSQIPLQTLEYQPSQICIIGGNRILGIQNTVETDAYFITDETINLDWFYGIADVEFEKIADEIEICVVSLGINDISNAEEYIKYLNEFAERHPYKICVYETVGPVDENKFSENKFSKVTNAEIETFNSKIQEGLNDHWQIADQYSYLVEKGFSSEDGIYYSKEDNEEILNWLINKVSKQSITVIAPNNVPDVTEEGE